MARDAKAMELTTTTTAAIDTLIIRIPYRLVLMGLVLTLGIVWGLQYSTAKLASLEGLEAFSALFAVHAVLAPLFVLFAIASGRTFWPSWRQAGYFAVTAFFTNLVPLGTELLVAHHISAGELTMIISLTPLSVLMFAMVLRSEAISLRKIAGILLGCTAGLAILMPQALAGGDDGLSWVLLAFVGPLGGGFGCVLLAKFWPDALDTFQVATGSLVAGALLLMPMAMMTGGLVNPVALAFENWSVAGFGFTVGVEFFLLALITRMSGAAFASCSDFIAICAGLMWGYVFFTEIPTMWMVAAACICALALKLAADATVAAAPRELA